MAIVTTPEPPAVSTALAGLTAQVGGKTSELAEIEQESATVPLKALTELSGVVVVLAAVAPEVRLSAAGALRLRDAPVTVTEMAAELTVVVPLVPVTVTLRVPAVPNVVAIVRTVLEELLLSTTEVGRTEQLPAALPLVVVTVHVSATVPAKLLREAMAIVSALPLVAPESNERLLLVGVIVKVGAIAAAAVKKLATSIDPRPVTSS
jgi:hypothetical protein